MAGDETTRWGALGAASSASYGIIAPPSVRSDREAVQYNVRRTGLSHEDLLVPIFRGEQYDVQRDYIEAVRAVLRTSHLLTPLCRISIMTSDERRLGVQLYGSPV
ncbi:hypothetical protein HAX54_042284 [Datura stramonium]|uniref:Uncharacterized protein n=1 Tax=Datura stramonium TaxID=4076 RepID=A0ABS8VZF2_DATST|nr:hypothetical protein [Datura stramonium]